VSFKLPKKVRIMGRDFEIIKGPEIPYEPEGVKIIGGSFNLEHGWIWLDDSEMGNEDLHETLFHEIMELLLWRIPTTTIARDDLGTPEFRMSHDTLRGYTNMLWATIRDNKLFVEVK